MESTYSFLCASAKRFPVKPAVIYKGRKYEYQELQKAAEMVKSWLMLRTEPQDVISVCMENSYAWLVSYFGIIGAACVCNPLSVTTPKQKVCDAVDFVQPKFLITSDRFLRKCRALSLPSSIRVVTTEQILREQDRPVSTARLLPTSVSLYAHILFTSGTTGKVKAARIANRVVCNTIDNITSYLQLSENDIYYAILPFCHSFGLGNVNMVIKAGGTVIVADNTINLRNVLQEIKDYEATFFAAVPLTLNLLTTSFLKEFKEAGEYLRLICTNTGPLHPETVRKILDHLRDTHFYTYYGLTEASRSTFHHFNDHPTMLNSVGKPLPGVKIKILDDAGHEVGSNQQGEICISGNNVIDEYWKNPGETKKTFKNGWMHTGDVGLLDPDGFLYVVGRQDDIVNIGGNKVSLEEIDRVIMEVEGVDDAATIQEPDQRSEFTIKCLIVAKHKTATLAQRVIERCKESLESFKVPRKVEFVNSIPRTESGKLQRDKLRRYRPT